MKRILIVDDDVHIGNMLEEVLTKEGYVTLRAYSGTEALYVLKNDAPDLVLLDLMLPGLNGEYLFITEDCNLRCPMCKSTVEMTGKNMPMEMFMRLVDETSPYCMSYSLFIWGEPLVLADFRERVEYVYGKKRGRNTTLRYRQTEPSA